MEEFVKFGDCVELIRDNVDPKTISKVPYIGLEHIEESTLHLNGFGYSTEIDSIKLRIKKGDILFGKLRPYFRKVVIAPFDGICSTDIWVVRAKEGFDQKYIFYWMAGNDFVDYSMAGSEGTKMPRAKWEHVVEFKRPYIDYVNQKRIGEILSFFDDKIELNRQMNQTLEAMARAIFKSWFVDFDPVYAKLEGRDYPLPPEIMDLFPDEMEESELGMIPKEWRVGKVEKNIEIQNGFAFKSEDYSSDGVFVFRTKNFSKFNNGERLKDDVYLPNEFLQSHKKFICQPFDLHVVMVGASVGKTSIIYPNCLPALRNQNMWCFRPKRHFFYRHFINLSMNDLIHKKLTWASGSARDFFRKSDFYEFKIIYPEKKLLERFENIVNSLFKKISLNLSSMDILESTRENLLPKLLSGEIEVNHV